MPFKKFRSVEEMDEARRDLWCEQPDEACFRRIAQLWKRSSQLSPRKYPKGVFKFRSLEEAQADREHWIKVNIQRLQEKHRTAKGCRPPKAEDSLGSGPSRTRNNESP